jgi:hypothetical protein
LNSETFFKLSKGMNIRSLGETTLGETDDTGNTEGYLFTAYEKKTVKDVLAKL